MTLKEFSLRKVCLIIGFLAVNSCTAKPQMQGTDAQVHARQETVVLLHGLIRSSISMNQIAKRLEREGYAVYNKSYPAREESIETIVDGLHERLKRCCLAKPGKINFVTHSMGGIVVRAYVDKYRPQKIGRVVMLGPPNKGTELADKLRDNALFGYIFGPVILELGTDGESTPNRLGEVDFELGVITGNRSWNPVASWMIPGADDGTVAVDSTKLKSMKDFLLVPNTHTFIMTDHAVIDEIVYFLKYGSFTMPASEDAEL